MIKHDLFESLIWATREQLKKHCCRILGLASHRLDWLESTVLLRLCRRQASWVLLFFTVSLLIVARFRNWRTVLFYSSHLCGSLKKANIPIFIFLRCSSFSKVWTPYISFIYDCNQALFSEKCYFLPTFSNFKRNYSSPLSIIMEIFF